MRDQIAQRVRLFALVQARSAWWRQVRKGANLPDLVFRKVEPESV
jgi:hypothetical protein